jgi:4-hydroxy-3-polyprenylbenzoate decarboxylase
MRRVIVAITGASGSIYGVRALEVLRTVDDVETHLVVSAGAVTTIGFELDRSLADIEALADVVHDDRDLAASIASGSYRVHGMIVAPCSIKTLSGVASSYDDTLTVRAADVRLKERQPLVLVVRETPFHLGHLKVMTAAAEAGAVIFPPVPSMYIRPTTIDDLVDHTIMRVLDQLDIELDLSLRWAGNAD